MLRLSEIRRLKDSVDVEWRSAIADRVAANWGIAPGSARWWRSSATHVFVVPGSPRRYLRFVPARSEASARLRRGAPRPATVPRGAGLVIARPLPNDAGDRVATVGTALGPMTAVLVEEAPGDSLHVDALSSEDARRWGASLALFHAHAPATDDASITVALTGSDDPELAEPLRRLQAALDDLDPASHRDVTVHGDFELDNIRFTDDGVAVFDFDETRYGSVADDIAMATRELRGENDAPTRPDLYAAFLAGYRSAAGLSTAEEAAVPLHSLRYSARRAADDTFLDEGGHPDDPEWQRELHDELREASAWHARAVRDASVVFES